MTKILGSMAFAALLAAGATLAFAQGSDPAGAVKGNEGGGPTVSPAEKQAGPATTSTPTTPTTPGSQAPTKGPTGPAAITPTTPQPK